MKLFLEYLKKVRKIWLLLVLFAIIFMVIFYLHNIRIDAVLYALLLCSVLAFLVFCIDFFCFYRNHQLFIQLKNQVSISIDTLPLAHNLIEQDYQELLTELFVYKLNMESETAKNFNEMVDYYTMWVHQIKTPLSAMRLLIQSESGNEKEELLDQLFKIDQYVEMVLQYLRTESMSSDLLIKEHQLDDLIRQGIRKYAKTFIRKKISLNYSGVDCIVLTDRKWLIFVIEQLLSNALKYTEPGGSITIQMDAQKEKAFYIEDTGIGIQAEDLPRIFEKGYTGYNGRSDKKSSGIGLYLCVKILKKLSHTIEVDSNPDIGTRFTISMDMMDSISE